VSVLPIHLMGSPVLRERARDIGAPDDEVRRFVADLFETMRAYHGVGLAANQVGVARRVAVVETDEQNSYVLIDPVIVESGGKAKDEEGCLSIPDIYGDVERPATVVVEATDVDGSRRRIAADGLLARAIQHEIDHLDGILFLDRLGPIKRRLLLRDWEKKRKGKKGHIREAPEPEDTARVG
jgi:peptide deformylase